jgi:EAL domain-containing protein (putative c-di-GMP-specific phosphodiesterase class I)
VGRVLERSGFARPPGLGDAHDRAFVAALETSKPDGSLAAAILSLARTLGLQTVAEGVETSIQAEVLATLGCQLAQGFYYAAPRDPVGMSRRLARERPLFHAAAGG